VKGGVSRPPIIDFTPEFRARMTDQMREHSYKLLGWRLEAREQRQAETIQRLVDTIPRLDRDEDIGPYIDDQGFRLPEPGEDEE
jgi:hypothetical protein